MINDDESFLSAYIDGQLDPVQHQRVESVIGASPQLAERVRGLGLVRDMVAGLPHDGWADVSARVVQEIQARRRQKGILPTLERWRNGSRRIIPLAGLATTAAALMIAASLALQLQTSQLERGVGPVAVHTRSDDEVLGQNPIIPVLVDGQKISKALEANESASQNDPSHTVAERTGPPSTAAQNGDQQLVLDSSRAPAKEHNGASEAIPGRPEPEAVFSGAERAGIRLRTDGR